MEFKFHTKRRDGLMPALTRFPCFVLIETSWDDYSYITKFVLNYYEGSRKKTEIGNTKILQKEKFVTRIPSHFTQLSENYCSLGQENSFYRKLYESFTRQEISEILGALNDITQSQKIKKSFSTEKGVEISLLRFSEAQKAFNEVPQILAGTRKRNSFHFEFSTQIPSFAIEHSVNFEFNKDSVLPRRISAIIGKNGSGKTQYLARLASSLSGLSERGKFTDGKLPPFSRVLAVSYSLFDRFERPKNNRSYSYFFCGFQSEKELSSVWNIERRIRRASMEIESELDLALLKKYLTELIDTDIASQFMERIHTRWNKDKVDFFLENDYTKLSSGQIMMITIMTELIAYLRGESIILFDEPETHLHPNAISKLIGIIYELAKAKDCFVIIATHSPQIVQEIPSSSIFYFDNDKMNPPVSPITIETFGENLTTLTEQIFNVRNVDENYKKIIRGLLKTYSKQEIFRLFKEKNLALSMNAKLFIEYQTIINDKPKRSNS